MLTENPQDMLDFEITEMHMNWLEESIKKNPQDWLWSHRRWKHKKPAQK
jgi:KDO2-lipid IV(A) lauroyltransferase